MDGIQPYSAPPRTPAVAHAAAANPAANPAAVKAPSDYARALRRRVWLVVMVGVPLSVAAAVWAVRQPPVYKAVTQIKIEPPQFDPVVSTLVSEKIGKHDAEATDRYLPNLVNFLKSKALAEEVVNDPAFLQGGPPGDDAADEFVNNLSARILTGSNWVAISLEGPEPARTAKQLTTLIEIFSRRIKEEAAKKEESPKSFATERVQRLQREVKDIDGEVLAMLQKTRTIGPGGTNIIQAEYENLGSALMHKRMRLEEIQQQAWVAQMFPKEIGRPEDASRLGQIEKLQETARKYVTQLEDFQRLVRDRANDPGVKHVSVKLRRVLDQIERLRAIPKEASLDPSETIVATMREEIHAAEGAAKELLKQLRDSMPEHERFLQLKDLREQKVEQLNDMQEKLVSLQMLSQYQNDPVIVPAPVAEPTVPVRPRRSLNIAVGIFVSFGLGIALVCLLEHLDHSVKVPEHLTTGLTLPLLGVVPRIRRTALTQRGGHLWTLGAPDSVDADAYRNLRASLLGVADRLGPIATLLVTSAKAGEGKSTTALNLAATCARAGERTLLVDVDLRRPSLAEVFADGRVLETGLVDVLRGALPWQRTVVRTDLPNLDFLPTGDTREIPIEVLGTLELRQLLIGLANHYDRVILDGPAVLGLADCRMLGRIVDAAVLVVRSGSHELRPLQRAKAMLEQSGVVLAGVVFNGLSDDLQNWSSYGPYQVYGDDALAGRSTAPRGGLDAPEDPHSALPLAGAVEG
jgi:capsular exopolysaccharide synthesis family protein